MNKLNKNKKMEKMYKEYREFFELSTKKINDITSKENYNILSTDPEVEEIFNSVDFIAINCINFEGGITIASPEQEKMWLIARAKSCCDKNKEPLFCILIEEYSALYKEKRVKRKDKRLFLTSFSIDYYKIQSYNESRMSLGWGWIKIPYSELGKGIEYVIENENLIGEYGEHLGGKYTFKI